MAKGKHMLKYKRILVTGAAGQLGQLARKALRDQVAYLRLNDIAAMAPAAGNEELWSCDLADAQSVGRMLQDVDTVIHLGASLNVDDWHDTLQVNIAGADTEEGRLGKAFVREGKYRWV